jgi:two-component system chemotaxis response regulator CheY
MNYYTEHTFTSDAPSISVLFLGADVLQGMLIRSVLLNSGIDVRIAVNEQEAHAAARTFHFDLVMAEWDSESLDGRAIVLELRKKVPHFSAVPAILVTYREVSDLSRFELSQRGFRCILQKPIVATSLPKLIKSMIGGEPYLCARFIACGETASGLNWSAVR